MDFDEAERKVKQITFSWIQVPHKSHLHSISKVHKMAEPYSLQITRKPKQSEVDNLYYLTTINMKISVMPHFERVGSKVKGL